MSECFNIRCTSLDNRLLQYKIACYEEAYKVKPYIFAALDTLTELTCDKELCGKYWTQTQCGIIGVYQGYRVFEDPTKAYGEVELR